MRRVPVALFGATLIALAATVGLLLLMRQLASPAADPTPATSVAVPTGDVATRPPETSTAEPTRADKVVATVDGIPITFAAWQTATRLDGVMSRLTRQPIPSAEETLDRLANEILLLREAGLEGATVTPAEAEARIASLEAGWGLTDAEVVSALEADGLTRRSLGDRVSRLILVEQAIEVLSVHYPDLDAWLAQARQAAEIGLYQPLDPTPAPDYPQSAALASVAEAATPVPAPTPTPTLPVPPTGLPIAPEVGAVAPDFELLTLDGETVRLSELRGRPALVNFWATWCPPCRAELPILQAAHERYGDRVTILGVDVKEARDTVADFAPQFGLTFPILLDSGGAVSDHLYQVRGIPTSLFIAADGVVGARHVGPLTEANIDQYLAPLLAPGSPEGDEPPGEPAPDFTLESAQGTPVALSDYRGESKVVLVFYRGHT